MTAFARQRCVILMCLMVSGPCLAAPTPKPAPATVVGLPAAGELIVGNLATGIALYGFDPVAFFEKSRPIAGKAELEVQHAGATWRFASHANREAFIDSPDDYLPLFGGYDPVAISKGRAVAGSPQHFAVINGRLALFHSSITRNQLVSAPDLLDAAIANWPTVDVQLAR